MNKKIVTVIGIVSLLVAGYFVIKKVNINPNYNVGQKIDSLNGVVVYYNGAVGNVDGRALAKDGYNLGLKHQCVEFVKRYYYQELNHKMPDTYGHAKDFFNTQIKDGEINKQRNLKQFTNPSNSKPQVNDLLVYSGTVLNKYGHVSIVSEVTKNDIEIIQQNAGPFGKSRERYAMTYYKGKWQIKNDLILGWLRK